MAELRLDETRPGVYLGAFGPVLGLAGLARRGDWETDALGPRALTRAEERLGRLEATYQPAGWHELTVRLAWYAPALDPRALELEVEILTRSVGELRGVEVMTIHTLASRASWDDPREQHGRDARRLELARDGREPRTIPMSTLMSDPGRGWSGLLGPDPAAERGQGSLALLAHPLDVSRQIQDGSGTLRIALFGHDLERGVVVRGRVRAWRLGVRGLSWRDPSLCRAIEAFLAEPPPLTT